MQLLLRIPLNLYAKKIESLCKKINKFKVIWSNIRRYWDVTNPYSRYLRVTPKTFSNQGNWWGMASY